MLGRPLQWKCPTDPFGSVLVALHRTLATARAAHPALRSAAMWTPQQDGWQTRFGADGTGTDTERRAAVFHRWATLADGRTETIVVALNFADADQTLSVSFPVAGGWTDLLGAFASGSWSVEVTDARADVPVGSHWGRLLHHAG